MQITDKDLALAIQQKIKFFACCIALCLGVSVVKVLK